MVLKYFQLLDLLHLLKNISCQFDDTVNQVRLIFIKRSFLKHVAELKMDKLKFWFHIWNSDSILILLSCQYLQF